MATRERRPCGALREPPAITPPRGPGEAIRPVGAGFAWTSGHPGRPFLPSSVAGRTAPAPKRRAARSAASSASRRPNSRAPSSSCCGAEPASTSRSARTPDQADPGPVEPEGVEQRPRGVVELLPDEDLADVAVDAVREGEVDHPGKSRRTGRRASRLARKRLQPGPPSAGQDDGAEHVSQHAIPPPLARAALPRPARVGPVTLRARLCAPAAGQANGVAGR